MSDALCIAYARNSWWESRKRFRKDGDEFVREANRFAGGFDKNGIDAVVRQYTSKNRLALRSMTIEDIADNAGFKTLAFFCHGSWKHMYGTGHQIWNVTELARAISLDCVGDPTILLFACSCGRGKKVPPLKKRKAIVVRARVFGKDGFAARLSAELGGLGVRAKVFAHTTKGHTTRNPMLCVTTTDPNARTTTTVYYREHIIASAGTGAWKRFCRLMREDPTFRFDVPYMKMDEVLDMVADKG